MFHTQFVDTFTAYLTTKFHAVSPCGSLVNITTKLKLTNHVSLSPLCYFRIYKEKPATEVAYF